MISLISSLSLKVAENSYLLFQDFQNYMWNFPDVELYYFEWLRNFFKVTLHRTFHLCSTRN